MALRMTSREVAFRHPFVLHGFDKIEPAGMYKVETEEEIDEVSFLVWKRVATVIHITRGAATEYVRIGPEDLRKAFARDSGGEESSEAVKARLLAAQRPGVAIKRVSRRKF